MYPEVHSVSKNEAWHYSVSNPVHVVGSSAYIPSDRLILGLQVAELVASDCMVYAPREVLQQVGQMLG